MPMRATLKHILLFSGLALGALSCKTTGTTTAYANPGDKKDKPQTATGQSVPKVVPTEELEQQAIFIDASREKMLGNYSEAIKLYEQCLNMNPNNAAAHYEIAGIFSDKNQAGLALAHAKAAATTDPKNAWYQMLYAHVLQQNYKYADAATVLQKLNKVYPDRIDYLAEYAEALLYAGKPDDALKIYDHIETLSGPSEDISLQKLKILSRKGDDAKVEQTLKDLIAANPKEERYYGMLGDFYQKGGKPQKAIEVYNQLIENDPDNGYVHLSLSDYYRQQHDDLRAVKEMKLGFASPNVDVDTKVKILLNYYYATDKPSKQNDSLKAEADTLCRLLIATHPDEAKGFSIYGDFLSRDNKPKEARDNYRKAIALDKNRYAIWNEVLLINSQLNDNEAQLTEAKQAIELFPSQPTPYFFLGLALSQKKQYQDAITNLQTGAAFVVDNNPLLVQFYSALGDAYNGLKDNAKSDDYFEKALVLDGENAYVLNNYSYFLSVRNEKMEKAEQMAKKANRLEPDNASYMDTYGWVLYRNGNFEEAKTWIEKALAKDPANGTLLEHMGDVLYKLGRTDDAVTYWKNAKMKGGGSDLLDKKINDKKLYE